MAEEDGLLALQGLHSDLVAFSENRLQDIERLVGELESRIEEFRSLLDKQSKSNTSRQKVQSGTVTRNDVEYKLDAEVQNQVIEVADELDLDEEVATELLVEAQQDAAELDRSATASAIIRFHKRRQFLLECLRLVITIAQDGDSDAEFRIVEFKRKVVNLSDTQVGNGSKYWQKCFKAMQDIEAWLLRLADRQQRVSVIGQSLPEEAIEVLELESASLLQQHECLATVCSLLIKDDDGYTEITDFKTLLGRMRTMDRHDLVVVHYLPVVLTFAARYGDADRGHCTPEEADQLNKLILAEQETEHWTLRNLHAATYVWWSSEYFSHFKQDSNAAEKRENEEADRFSKALQDGAFHFMLSVASDIRKPDWYDPAKAGLISFLLQDAVSLTPETAKPAPSFQRLFMGQLQQFVDAFIANMPNTLRNLKNEEDKQRRELLARFQKNTMEYQYHLERFLVLLALAFEESPEGALMFWDDADSNLYGFLQWAAKRQTTPRVAAFCEMLGALAEGETNASAAHRFLLEEGSPIAGKLRRTGSLSWNQIYAEIFFYAKTIRDRPAPVHSGDFAGAPPPGQTQDVVEPESAMMLECYLRLVTQLCRHSSQARTFVLEWQHESLTLRDILFQLASSQIDSRLRACAFTTLSSLLTNKRREESDTMWTKLDQWISGGSAPASTQPQRAPARPSPSWSEHVILETIAAGFEEANSFLGLLNGLISAGRDDYGLNDSLPFPENLGSTYRMPGIDSYVDFAVGKAFGERTAQVTDLVQLRLLRLSCLDFIATCLSTFNEDLVVVANRSSFPVDAAIHTSSLEAYVRLHPFARVMEWLYNERVLTALFATAHQDINEVNGAANDSPYILSLVRSIEVMDLIMKLQPTYIDVVRPLVKSKSDRRHAIAHSAIASFEDALLNNLHVVVDLGLYCGTGHQELTLASLSLLEKLSSSKKLVVSPAAGFGKYSDRSKLIGVYEQNDDADRVARSLIAELRIDGRELEGRQLAPGYVIKTSILGFLKNCLLALPDRPTLAHLLLGFICRVRELEIGGDSLIAEGASLFHAIVTLAIDYPEIGPVPPELPVTIFLDEEEEEEKATKKDEAQQIHPMTGAPSHFAWLSNIREACMDILSLLWRSPISNVLVMNELRSLDFVFVLAMRQDTINANTLWDGKTIRDGEFLYSDSAIGFRDFLRQRTSFYDYLARELQVAATEKMNGLRERLQGVLMGATKFPGQEPLASPTVFDLFDFMELEIPAAMDRPPWENFADIDFDVCRVEGKGSYSPYDIAGAQELMLLRRNELTSAVAAKGAVMAYDDPLSKQFNKEFKEALVWLNGLNQRQELLAVHAETLRAWAQLLIVSIEQCDFDAPTRTAFAMQTLQLILPKLEHALGGYSATALWTARTLLQLVQVLMKHVGLESKVDAKTDFGNDRSFNVFRTALAGIYADLANSELRTLCYNICYQYLQITLRSSKKGSVVNRHILRSVKLAGERLLDVVCDDAYSGEGRSRVAAVMLLDALVLLSNVESSNYMLEGFARLNFVGVLIDGVKGMPQDIHGAEDVKATIVYYTSTLSLLLRLAQGRHGATAMLNAGLFPVIRASALFSTDPDIGLDVDNPAALKIFFELMLAVLKIVAAVLMARGVENSQMKDMVRDFLSENRGSLVAVFKRNAKIGWRSNGAQPSEEDDAMSVVLSECVDMYSLLISATGWLEHEDMSTSHGRRERLTVFS